MQLPYRKPGKFSETKLDPFLTQEKLAELKKKLETLQTIKQPRAAAEVSRLAELGDFSENAEYQLAKGRLRSINNAILTIDNQIKHAVIIKPDTDTDVVHVGHTVTLESDKGIKVYEILGSSETNPSKGIISHNSPIGAAIVGRKIGEVVTIQLGNKEVIYKILKAE